MGRLLKKSPLEKRLKELEREARLVRADIQTLTRVLKTLDRRTSVPRSKSLPLEGSPPRNHGPAPEEPREPTAPPWAPPEELSAEPAPGARQGEEADEQVPVPATSHGDERRETTPKAEHLRKDQRFASYFSSGNFLGAPPARADGRIHRNKAVFMVLLVVVFGFILWRLLF